ncbi:MAG: GAF domain-containing protein [Chloroflexota bacterium]
MDFWSNLTLSRKLVLLTTLGLVLAIVVFSFLGLRAVRQATETMLDDRLTTAHIVASYLDETLGRALTELQETVQRIAGDSTGANFEARVEELKGTYDRLSIRTVGMYLLGQNGQIMWSQSGIADGSVFSYPGLNQVIEGRQASISGLVMAPGNVPAILLAAPMRYQGKIEALVVAVDPGQSSIGSFVRLIKLGQTGYVEIVDQNGIVVARTEPGPKLAPFEKSEHSGRFADLIAASEPTRGLCHTCHEPVQRVERRDMLAFVPLSQAYWGVVIRQSETEALAPVNELRRNLIFLGAGLITLTLLFVAVAARSVVARVGILTAASRRIAGGDLNSPVAASGKDELGVLSQSFEEMRMKLRTSREEIEQRTKELSVLLSVSEVLATLSDLSDLEVALGGALDKTLEIMQADTGGILLWDEEQQKLRYHVSRGLSAKYVKKMNLDLGKGIAGKVAQSGEAIWMEDISADARAADSSLIRAEGLRGFACVPLRSKGRVLGVLNVADRGTRKFSAQDARFLESIAGQMATAIENTRLHQEVQHKDEMRGELLREVMSIQEEERGRIARELHDETSQVLASLTANLEAASGMLPLDSENVKTRLKQAQSLSVTVLDEIHRLIYELRPSLLDDLGLVTAVRWLAENNLQTIGVKVNFKTVGRVRRLGQQLETTLFRVIQEAITNIARHAEAKNAEITLHFKKGIITIHVKDDGLGFDVAEALSSKERPRGLGLLGMKERVELANGTLSVQSYPGGGTEINIEIPLE